MIKIFGPHTKMIKNGKYTNFKGQMKEFDRKMDLMMAFQNLELFMGIKFETRQTQRLPRTIVAFISPQEKYSPKSKNFFFDGPKSKN